MAVREVPLTQGKVALVDEEDFERVSAHKWYAGKDRWTSREKPDGLWYACRWAEGRKILMHRFILGLVDRKMEADHINGDTLDNRRVNLRIVTHRQNGQNRREHRAGRPCGIILKSDRKSYQARIRIAGKRIHLGSFPTAEEASQAYWQKVQELESKEGTHERN